MKSCLKYTLQSEKTFYYLIIHWSYCSSSDKAANHKPFWPVRQIIGTINNEKGYASAENGYAINESKNYGYLV